MVEPGKPATVTVYGRNLPGGQLDPTAVEDGRVLEKLTVMLTAPTEPGALQRLAYQGHLTPAMSALDGFEYRIRSASGASNPFLITYARASVVLDGDNHNTPETAQEIPVPCEIAGRIEKKHDRDWYSFSAKKGEIYNIEVFSDRLGCQTDMYFVVQNPATKQVLADLDDNPDSLARLKFFTRNEDPPPFRFVVPADGKYQLLVSSRDADVRAGPRQYYRVRITPEQPDFRLIVMPPADGRPDACRLLQGGEQFFTVLVWRLDGWNGPINLTADGLPAGVTCAPQIVAAGIRQVPLVLSAAPNAALGIFEMKVKGSATINGQTVMREARSASITWPTPPQQNIPAISRLDRNTLMAVREQAPYRLTAVLDKPAVVQGDKPNLTVKLTRLWPDFKGPLQAIVLDFPNNLVAVNNNQPIAFAPGKDEAKVVVDVKPTTPPGTYTVVLRSAAQMPYNKDPMAKQKPNINVVQPSEPFTITVLPKQVATLSLPNPNLTLKAGNQGEVLVKLARMYDFAGEFKVKVVLPPNAKGVTVDDVTVPAGKDEVKLIVRVAADTQPINLANLTVQATAMFNGNLPTVHEGKINVNVTK
jgi:hypothetical protein